MSTADAIAKQARWLREKLTIEPKTGSCEFVDLLIELSERQQRVPTELTLVDGYPAGGSGGRAPSLNDAGAPNSRIEATTIKLLDAAEENATRANQGLDPVTTDPVAGQSLLALDMWTQCFMSAKAAYNAASEADRISTVKLSVGKTTGPCETVGGDMLSYEIPCGELAFTKGLCRGCYDELRRINDKRHGLEPLTALSRAQADDWFKRRSKRRTHIDGPLAEGA